MGGRFGETVETIDQKVEVQRMTWSRNNVGTPAANYFAEASRATSTRVVQPKAEAVTKAAA